MRRDHPRSRGVYSVKRRSTPPRAGSSPLARGLPERDGWAPPPWGIIPARAGFTFTVEWASKRVKDHPRSRGVYRQLYDMGRPGQGSSPLARGLPAGGGAGALDAGIIPARAGFTRRRPGPTGPWSDHPRSRGVYSRPSGGDARTCGSSPLARGLLPPPLAARLVCGIIPARAGFTRRRSPRAGRRADHPRSRGVYRGHSSRLS